MTNDHASQTPRDIGPLSEIGTERLREIAAQQAEPAGFREVAAYRLGWLSTIVQFAFGVGFLIYLTVGTALVILGDATLLQWQASTFTAFFIAYVSGKTATALFQYSGVEP